MARKIGRGDAPYVLLGLFRWMMRRSPRKVWFQLNLRKWAKSNGICYQTALHALQDLAAVSGDFEVPENRKRRARPLRKLWAIEAAEGYKFRCIQVDRQGKGAHFVWHVASRDRLAYDQEPLFYREDRETDRHVRQQLRALDVEAILVDGEQLEFEFRQPGRPRKVRKSHCNQTELTLSAALSVPPAEQLELALDDSMKNALVKSVTSAVGDQTAACEPTLVKKGMQYQTTPPLLKEPSVQQFSITTPARPGCCERTRGKLRRTAYSYVHKLQAIHENSTGKVSFSRPHAVSFMMWGLERGYQWQKIVRAYEEAHEFSTMNVVDGMARVPLALLQWRAKENLRGLDRLSRGERIQKFYLDQAEERAKVRRLLGGDMRAPAGGCVGHRQGPSGLISGPCDAGSHVCTAVAGSRC